MKRILVERIGETRKMNSGLTATIVGYRLARDVDVQFESGGTAVGVSYHDFKRGKVACPTIVKHENDYAVIINPNKSFSYLCDKEDAEFLSKYAWNDSHGYAYNAELGFAHRYIMGVTSELQIDHINRNMAGNRKCNLRTCTIADNQHNVEKPITNKSGYEGVFWDKTHKKWCARIRNNGVVISLGYFDGKHEAAHAYNKAAMKYHGEFAKLNNMDAH